MSFTDDDLKRLKEMLALPTKPGTYNIVYKDRYYGTLDALIARLEAAEKVVNAFKEYEDYGGPCNCAVEYSCCECNSESLYHDVKEAVENWRRAAGK